LAAILGWGAAMTDARLGPALVAPALEALRRTAALQSRIAADLVDLSRRGRGRLSLQLERVDLGGVVAAATDALAMTATTRGIKVVINVAGCPPVQGDAARLQQVVSNLLGNALKHSDCGTTVHVDVDALGDRARIVVRDEGHGIARVMLTHILEPYRQGAGGYT